MDRRADQALTEQLTAEDIAQQLGVSPASFRSYVSRGNGPTPDGHLGRTPWWTQATVDAWRAARRGRGIGGGRPTAQEKAVRDTYMDAHRALTDYALATPVRDLGRFEELQRAEREAKARWDEVIRARAERTDRERQQDASRQV